MAKTKEKFIKDINDKYNPLIDKVMEEVNIAQEKLDNLQREIDGLVFERNQKIDLINKYFESLEISKINIEEII